MIWYGHFIGGYCCCCAAFAHCHYRHNSIELNKCFECPIVPIESVFAVSFSVFLHACALAHLLNSSKFFFLLLFCSAMKSFFQRSVVFIMLLLFFFSSSILLQNSSIIHTCTYLNKSRVKLELDVDDFFLFMRTHINNYKFIFYVFFWWNVLFFSIRTFPRWFVNCVIIFRQGTGILCLIYYVIFTCTFWVLV